jgi:hypothetical protein
VATVGRARPRRPALALAIAVSGPAAGIDVSWDAPPSCPDAATARAEILARVTDPTAAHELRVMARVRQLDDDAWQVTVELSSEQGTATRTLEAPSCSEALTATAVVVAIAVAQAEPPVEIPTPPAPPASIEPPPAPAGQPALAEDPPATQGRATETVASVEDPPVEPASPKPTASARRELALSVGARAGLDYGALPSPAAHLAASAGLLGRRFLVQAGVVHRVRTEASLALPSPAGGRFRLTAAELVAGPRLAWGAFELPLWGGLELGAIWARGIGEVEPIAVRRLWAAGVASVGAGWAPLPALALHLGVEGVVPLARPTFTLGESVEVLTVGPIAVRAWLGVSGRFSL